MDITHTHEANVLKQAQPHSQVVVLLEVLDVGGICGTLGWLFLNRERLAEDHLVGVERGAKMSND